MKLHMQLYFFLDSLLPWLNFSGIELFKFLKVVIANMYKTMD